MNGKIVDNYQRNNNVDIVKEKDVEEARIEVLIQSIQDIRSDNNKAWMKLLRLAFQFAPEQAQKIFSEITENDRKINELSKRLCE